MQNKRCGDHKGTYLQGSRPSFRVGATPYLGEPAREISQGKDIQEAHDGIQSLNRTFWGRHIWARGYFVASSGNVTDEVIMKYIEQQNVEPPDGDFKVEDEL
jgi:putative transposase